MTTTLTSTKTPVVLVADKMDPDGVRLMEDAGLEVRVQTGLAPEALVAAARDVDGILVRSASKITADVLAAASRLRAVGRAGIGVDNIDIPAASRHGVLVMNTPTANATTTAELALAHLFSLARNIPAADRSMHEGRWDKSKLVGRELTGKTLGVIGLGKIGRIVAERALGLKMRVLAFDPYLQGDTPVPGVELADWDALLSQADFVTIHVPGGKDTAGLVDGKALAKMKKSAYLINCARGGIVAEDDLIAALEQGTIAGAALDVYTSEPLPEDSPLRAAPNLVLTPHLGASSGEAQKRVSTEIAQQMADYLLRDEARCALNAPALSADTLAVLRPFITLARRCGLLLTHAAEEPVVGVQISYVGDLCRYDVEPVRIAVLAGLLAPTLDGPVNAVNAPLLAAERGIQVLEEQQETGSEFTAALRVEVWTSSDQRHTVAGTTFRGKPRLVMFDGFGVDFVPQGELLMTQHKDAPGVLGRVATWLGDRGINIGGLHMGQPQGGGTTALALYQLDRALTPDEEAQLATFEPILSARSFCL